MNPSNHLHLTAAALCALATTAFAQTTATTAPVGFITVTAKANSDYRLSIPMVNAPAFTGRIASISSNVITVDATAPFTANQFQYNSSTQKKYFYAMIASGTKEGMQVPITTNGTNTLTVSLGSNNLSGVSTGPSGDQVKVFAYFSLKTLITDQASPALPDNAIDVLTFDGNITGVNPSSSSVFTYFAGFGWFDGSGNPSDDVYLEPGEGLIVRNRSASDLNVVILGAVPVNKHYYLLKTLAANTSQDIPLGYIGAADETLSSAGLPAADQDSILVFNNTAVGFNKSASQVLTFFQGFGWFDGGGTQVDATFKFQPGFSYVYRKAPTATATAAVWQDTPSYLPIP